MYVLYCDMSLNFCQGHTGEMAKHFDSIRRTDSDNRGNPIQIEWKAFIYCDIAQLMQKYAIIQWFPDFFWTAA